MGWGAVGVVWWGVSWGGVGWVVSPLGCRTIESPRLQTSESPRCRVEGGVRGGRGGGRG